MYSTFSAQFLVLCSISSVIVNTCCNNGTEWFSCGSERKSFSRNGCRQWRRYRGHAVENALRSHNSICAGKLQLRYDSSASFQISHLVLVLVLFLNILITTHQCQTPIPFFQHAHLQLGSPQGPSCRTRRLYDHSNQGVYYWTLVPPVSRGDIFLAPMPR